jgi:hypothetical protein
MPASHRIVKAAQNPNTRPCASSLAASVCTIAGLRLRNQFYTRPNLYGTSSTRNQISTKQKTIRNPIYAKPSNDDWGPTETRMERAMSFNAYHAECRVLTAAALLYGSHQPRSMTTAQSDQFPKPQRFISTWRRLANPILGTVIRKKNTITAGSRSATPIHLTTRSTAINQVFYQTDYYHQIDIPPYPSPEPFKPLLLHATPGLSPPHDTPNSHSTIGG